jgi:hypothetical protein
MPRTVTSNAVNPLPSLIRASAWDAADQRMRKAGRKVWSRADYNAAAAMQERLTLACYGRKWDRPGSNLPFLRFQIAEQYERNGEFNIKSDFAAVSEAIDASLVANFGIPLTH